MKLLNAHQNTRCICSRSRSNKANGSNNPRQTFIFSLRLFFPRPETPGFHPVLVHRSNMSRPHPHPLALFSLIPYDDNKRAKAVVAHPCNSHLISTTTDGELALDVGFHIRSKSHNTLATLGRGDTDIFVDGASIAKIQCSFEIDLDTNVVMLYDRSYYRTTQVYGENAMPFEHERLPQVVVQANLNTVVGMGGEGRNLVQFELIWHQDPDGTIEKVKNREDIVRGYEEHPRIARTIMDETDTVFPSRRETRIHTPGTRQLKMRYMTIGDMLGAGQFGEVYKAVNVDSGKLMAVKMLKLPDDATKKQRDHWRESVYYALKREVENLAKINHVSKSNYRFYPDDLTSPSHTLLIISHHKAGMDPRWRYLWV